jgi:hypothetical protein
MHLGIDHKELDLNIYIFGEDLNIYIFGEEGRIAPMT